MFSLPGCVTQWPLCVACGTHEDEEGLCVCSGAGSEPRESIFGPDEPTVTLTLSLREAARLNLFAFLKSQGYEPWPKAIGNA